MTSVAHNFVIIARQLSSNNNYEKAFNMYMCAFDKDPRVRKRYESEFRGLLSRMNEHLAAAKKKADIFYYFEKAIKVFPGNVNLLSDIGNYLYRYGYVSEALCHFEKAFIIDSSFASVEKNLNNAKTFLFPRTQFKMLNDKVRKNAFRMAIRRCVSKKDCVLVIDAKIGLLALYANERNPLVITACESSDCMARLAECVMQENYAPEVVIVNKPSMMLRRADIYGTRSVLLTDAFDSGLFGAYILQTLTHAWENLLFTNSKIIPGKAEYFIVGVKCDELYNKYKLHQEAKNILNVKHLNVHTTTYCGETYHSEDVYLYKDLKYMCEPKSLFTINFNSYQDVTKKFDSQTPFYAKLNPTEDGEINMLIGWFNLHLTDNIMVTTDPRSVNRASAYQQAVFFDSLTRRVRINERVNIPFTSFRGKLSTVEDTKTTISRISPDSIAYLNDTQFINLVMKSINAVCVHVGQTVKMDRVNIVDFSPFPLFGLLMMKRGAKLLICHAKTYDDLTFLQTVLAANGISQSKVRILVRGYWCQEYFTGKKFHAIFSQIIDFNGDVHVKRNIVARHLSHCQLATGGICLPASVTMMGQLIFSSYLEINNRVVDDKDDYRIAKHVNRYQVSQALNIDMTRLDYEVRSDVFEITNCEDVRSEVIKVPVLEDGECNAILCWYKVKVMEHWDEVYTNRSNSFVQSMAYVTTPNVKKVWKGQVVDVIKCVDAEGPFKLVLEI